MLTRVEIVDEWPDPDTTAITYRNCVDLEANGLNEALPTPAHHHSVHPGATGKAGGSPVVGGPLFQAGNWVLPMYPFLPIPEVTGCESFDFFQDQGLPVVLPFSIS